MHWLVDEEGENEGGNEIQWWLKVFPVVSRELSVANHWHDRYAAISYEANHGSYQLRDYNEITLIDPIMLLKRLRLDLNICIKIVIMDQAKQGSLVDPNNRPNVERA